MVVVGEVCAATRRRLIIRSRRKARLLAAVSILLLVAVAAGLVLYALRQNINLYFTPAQLVRAKVGPQQLVRVGGWVQPHSIVRQPGSLRVEFAVTDRQQIIRVVYNGVLPSLFKEGKGVVVQGYWRQHILRASTVLAKHDANYRPPELASS